MKRNLLMVGLPIAASLSLTLAGCGNPVAEREEGELQNPGAVPTNVEEDDQDDDAPGKGVNAQEADDEENENEND